MVQTWGCPKNRAITVPPFFKEFSVFITNLFIFLKLWFIALYCEVYYHVYHGVSLGKLLFGFPAISWNHCAAEVDPSYLPPSTFYSEPSAALEVEGFLGISLPRNLQYPPRNHGLVLDP